MPDQCLGGLGLKVIAVDRCVGKPARTASRHEVDHRSAATGHGITPAVSMMRANTAGRAGLAGVQSERACRRVGEV